MRPLALSLLLALSPAAFADAPLDLQTWKTRARAQFLAHMPGQPTIDQAVPPLPADGSPESAELRMMLDSIKDTELGCVQPCQSPADMLVYKGKVELIATKLGAKDAEFQAAIDHYLPEKKPRLRVGGAAGQQPSPSDKMVEAKVVEQLLKDNKIPPMVQQSLGRKALAIASSLGTTQFVSADGKGPSVMGSLNGHQLTAQQIAQLNQIPNAQAQVLRSLATKAIPAPPTKDERQSQALQEMEDEIARNPGQVRQARNYWISESQNKDNNFLWRGYSYFNRGLLAMSGLTEVEESAARTGWASAHPDISAARTAWEGTKLVGNSAMFAANFVGLSGAGQVANRARNLGNPVVLEGVVQLEKQVGREVVQQGIANAGKRAERITTVVSEALGSGKNYKAATQAMDRYAAEELGGILRVERGGKWGEANFHAIEEGANAVGRQAGTIKYSPLVGEAHEFAHAQQMLVNRSAALELVATKAGKPIGQLSQAEVKEAMNIASELEKAYYAQHEAQALRSAGFMGLTPGSNYATKLGQNGAELVSALGGNPAWQFTRGQKLFGALSGMGESQLAIAGTLSAHANVPFMRQQYSGLLQMGENAVGIETPTARVGKK